MATVQNTIEFLQSHGSVIHVAVTPDGLLATAWEGGETWAIAQAIAPDDAWCEAAMVFPIVDGNVSNSAVRAWLGY